VISRRNDIRDELSYLASKAITPSAVNDEPKIHTGRPTEEKMEGETESDSVKRVFHNKSNDDRGDILIR
jgi:hypothetical protein